MRLSLTIDHASKDSVKQLIRKYRVVLDNLDKPLAVGNEEE